MVLKMTFCDELLIADLTLVVALPEMTLEVDVQVAFLSEFIATKVALIWLDP